MAEGVFKIVCRECGASYNVKAEWVGRKAKCRHCGAVSVIPKPGAAQASPPATPVPHPAQVPPLAAQPQPLDDEDRTRALPRPAGAVGLGQVFLWTGEGIKCGLRQIVPLTVAVLVFTCLVSLAWSICAVPGVFLEPPLLAGFVLILLGAARGEQGLLGKLFAGFSEGRYWPSMGIVWLLWLVFTAAAIPVAILLLIIGVNALMFLLSEGTVGLLAMAILVPLVFSPVVYMGSRLAWAMPLVLEGRARVVESLSMSWQLTGQVARGFGLFVQILVLSLASLMAQAVIFGGALTVFGVSMIGAVSATDASLQKYPEAMREIQRLSAMPGETPQDFEARKTRQLHTRLGIPLPSRTPGESDTAYWSRARRELDAAIGSKSIESAGTVAVAGTAGLTVAAILVTVLGAALGAILAVPVMVGYRDMCGQVPPRTG